LAREQLYIDNKYIPLSKSINASITKSIADIAEPDKRKATYSKTTSIPNSKEAQKVFTAIYELNLQEYTNSSLQDITFNPTIKIDCTYIVDGEPIIEGYCQLKSITQTNNNELVYNIVMFGSIANIFREMGEDYLDSTAMVDVLDRWNHPYDISVQEDSWATQVWDNDASAFIPFALGTGYVYPLIDYGLTTNLTDFPFDKMGVAIYTREYMNAIFEAAGFTWTSTFLDSTYFKSLIIPSSPSNFQLDSDEIDDREFEADTSIFFNTGSATSANLNKGSFGSLGVVRFSNEVADPGANYDPATGVFTVVNTGVYNVNAVIGLIATFTPDSGGNVVCTSDIEGRAEIFVNGAVVQSIPFYVTYDDYPTTYSIGARSTTVSPTTAGNDSSPEYITNAGSFSSVTNPASAVNNPRQANPPNKYLCSFQNLSLNATDTVDVRIKARYRGLNNIDNQMFYSGSAYSGGNATLGLTTASKFFTKAVNNYPAYGSLLKISKCIPKKIKQKDFFMSIVKMFNLWIDVDPDNQKNLLIEPRDSFLGTDIIDIQDKIAQDKPLTITPMGKLDAVDFLYTYKPDKDYYNEKYTSQWDQVYGEREINTTNDFVRGSKKTEIIFSPTPCVAPPLSDRVIPTIIQVDDNGQPKETDFNIRILYYGGLKTSFNTWNHIYYPVYNIPTPTVHTTYPYAGHYDDPFNATEDINFGLTQEVYYDDNIQNITVTNNNLVNKYHLNMLNAYTSKNSKIVTAYVNMSPTDFKTWDFAKLYFFENAYFRLNKVNGYNPTGEGLTKCEFLYLATVELFEPRYPGVDGAGDEVATGVGGGGLDDSEDNPGKGGGGTLPDGNGGTGKGQVIEGNNNEIAADSYYIEIYGDDNRVFSEVENVKIHGDNNTIDAGQKNIVLINTSGLTIEESDVTYIDGVKVDAGSISAPSAVEDISASQTVEVDVKAYKIDSSGGDITMTYDLAFVTYTEGQIWYFKKEDAANNIIIAATGGTIDGSSSVTYSGDNDEIPVMYCGGTEFIII